MNNVSSYRDGGNSRFTVLYSRGTRLMLLVLILAGLTLCLVYGIKETIDKHREDTDNESD